MNFRTGLVISAVALLAGCATPGSRIESNVTVFHQMPAATADATYAVLPWKKADVGSLEFAAYAQQLASGLTAKGLNVVANGSPAKYGIFLDFGIDDGRTETASYSIPQWGVTGYGNSTTTGTVNRVGNTAYVNATTTATPNYGVTGYNQIATTSQIYRRFVNIDIVEMDSVGSVPKKVYQGRLKSEGSCGNLPTVMPSFIQALLSEFPGTSGTARTVSLPWSGKC
ncbi:hypothetical protein RugamoR57_37520 [Duganella caerulea]|uniref:hypothetical protein n=1 Tax=Duganella caerulea TaxID=2885762 RepID=UPI0030E8B07F